MLGHLETILKFSRLQILSCRRLLSDDVYPLRFLLFGSSSVPPRRLEITMVGVLKQLLIEKTLARSVWMHRSAVLIPQHMRPSHAVPCAAPHTQCSASAGECWLLRGVYSQARCGIIALRCLVTMYASQS